VVACRACPHGRVVCCRAGGKFVPCSRILKLLTHQSSAAASESSNSTQPRHVYLWWSQPATATLIPMSCLTASSIAAIVSPRVQSTPAPQSTQRQSGSGPRRWNIHRAACRIHKPRNWESGQLHLSGSGSRFCLSKPRTPETEGSPFGKEPNPPRASTAARRRLG
jgi:hypothetical protein